MEINTVAGIDAAYFIKDNIEYGVSSIVVIDYKRKNILEKKSAYDRVTYPYERGKLYKRELPLILKAYHELEHKVDVFMLDGNGYLHESHYGIATVFGKYTSERSIGVSKTFYNFNNIDISFDNDLTEIVFNNELYGYALKSRKNCNPIFISKGNLISNIESLEIVRSLIDSKHSRIPIPTRYADIETHIMRKKLINNEI